MEAPALVERLHGVGFVVNPRPCHKIVSAGLPCIEGVVVKGRFRCYKVCRFDTPVVA